MQTIEYQETLLKTISKIKDHVVKEKIKKQIKRIVENPEIGKPMRYTRKGTRELYIGSYRLAYAYFEKEKRLIFLGIYHKDEQ
jgi:mRNA-degrading endonuclease RelE of RelBE toxin-antitoxin system